MKKIFSLAFALVTVLVFGGLSGPNDNSVVVENKDTKLPDWQWSSGEVEMHKTAAKQCFTISFSPKIYRPRDSIKITFSSYKVTLTNLDQGKHFGQWQGKVELVRFINNNWIPLVDDTLDRINRPFSGKNNIVSETLNNYSVYFTVPLSRTLTISTSAITVEIDNTNGSPLLENGKAGPTLTTNISGIEVKKLEQN